MRGQRTRKRIKVRRHDPEHPRFIMLDGHNIGVSFEVPVNGQIPKLLGKRLNKDEFQEEYVNLIKCPVDGCDCLWGRVMV